MKSKLAVILSLKTCSWIFQYCVQDLVLLALPLKSIDRPFSRMVSQTRNTASLNFNNFVILLSVQFAVTLNSSRLITKFFPVSFRCTCAVHALLLKRYKSVDKVAHQSLLDCKFFWSIGLETQLFNFEFIKELKVRPRLVFLEFVQASLGRRLRRIMRVVSRVRIHCPSLCLCRHI